MKIRNFALFILLSCSATSLWANSKTPGKVIAGYVEKIVIENQSFTTKAKLDTGAKTSAIYADKIERFRKNGQRWVEFTLILNEKVTLERQRVRQVKIKGDGGDFDARPVVELDICFNGRHYTTEFTLADRGEYIYPVLLGREFLNGKALVDPEETFLTLASCP
jgi:hypothetical protein